MKDCMNYTPKSPSDWPAKPKAIDPRVIAQVQADFERLAHGKERDAKARFMASLEQRTAATRGR